MSWKNRLLNKLESNQTADQIKQVFDNLQGTFGEAAHKKNLEYAKRILAGEDPNDVLQGLKVGGAMWNAVMTLVNNAKNQKQISLSDLSNQVSDINWHSIYNWFSERYKKNPQDPKTIEIGKALYQAAISKNMKILNPYVNEFRGKLN